MIAWCGILVMLYWKGYGAWFVVVAFHDSECYISTDYHGKLSSQIMETGSFI